MKRNKGQSPIQYATVILVIVALVGSWMAYSTAGQGATESQVNEALKDTPTRSNLDQATSDIMDAIRGKEVTKTDVASFLSGKDWSSAKSILERAGIDVPEITKPNLVEKAKEEGKVVIYHAIDEPDMTGTIIPRFKELYPWATVQQVGMSPTALASKVRSEIEAGEVRADVVNNVNASMAPLIGTGAFAAIEPNGEVMETYKHMDFPEGSLVTNEEGNPIGVPSYGAPTLFVYNPDVIEEPPHSFKDFTKERYKGEIAMDPPWGLADSGLMYTTLYGMWGEEEWTNWMEDFAANDPVICDSTSRALTMCMQGEVGISTACIFDLAAEAKAAEEEDRKMTFKPIWDLEVYTIVPQAGYKIAGAPHPAMQKLFLKWWTSLSGQNAIGATGRPPLSPTAQAPIMRASGVPSDVTYYPGAYNVPGFYKNTQKWGEKLKELLG